LVEKDGPDNNLITHHSLMVVNVCRAVETIVAVDSLASELCSVSGNNKTKPNLRIITMIGISVKFPLRELNVLLSDNFLINLPVESNHKTTEQPGSRCRFHQKVSFKYHNGKGCGLYPRA